jgi:hypothetical protein
MTDATTNGDLAEPLLPLDEVETAAVENGDSPSSCALAGDDDNGASSNMQAFSMKEEILEMVYLGIPLAVSFFCRMVS